MKLKPNQAVDYTTQINDTFWRLQRSKWSGEEWFNDKETALCFNVGSDFRTMAESVPYIPMIAIRYNWHMKVCDKFNMLIILNLN